MRRFAFLPFLLLILSCFLPLLVLILSCQPGLAAGDLSATQNLGRQAANPEPFLMERFDGANKEPIKGIRMGARFAK